MNLQELERELVVALMTFIVITLTVAFCFAYMYPREKCLGRLKFDVIIKSAIKKSFGFWK
jgi:uncharacterized membrane protein